jgi:hypothetical protein
VIERRLACPKFREAHEKGRDYADRTSYFGTPGLEQLDVLCNRQIGKDKLGDVAPTSVWLNGVDAVNLVNNSRRKSAVHGIMCEELPPELAYTHAGFHAYLIIEGPEC